MNYILHYVNKMHRGGMESLIMNLYRNIDSSEYQFHFAVHTDVKADFDDEIEKLGGKIIVFPNHRSNPIRYRKVWNEFWRENKDKYLLFHFHTNSLANIESIKAAKDNGFNNIIVHAHSSYASKGKLQIVHDFAHKRNQKYVAKNDVYKIAVSEKAKNWVFGNNQEVEIVNNGINYSDFNFSTSKRATIRNQFSIGNDEIVIGQVGNFNPVKNHKFSLKVFKEFTKTNNNSKLLFVGGGPRIDEIRQIVKNENLEDKVIFVGIVSNVSDYLSAMDIFIFPSIFEGLGLVAVEAQVNGLPVLYSNTVPKDIEISSNVCSLSIDENPVVWANKLNDLITVRSSTKNLNSKFEISSTVRNITDIYLKFN
ncbi:glycosyltransferase [Aerococcus sp. L_4]